MNWKEQLPQIIKESKFFSEDTATESLEGFIRDEIIGKLIDDIPGNGCVLDMELKQQLKAKWLERK